VGGARTLGAAALGAAAGDGAACGGGAAPADPTTSMVEMEAIAPSTLDRAVLDP
jgi:hypothetical protein